MASAQNRARNSLFGQPIIAGVKNESLAKGKTEAREANNKI